MHCEDANTTAAKKQWSRTGQMWSYIWLAYSGFYFIEPVLRRNLRYWVETVCVYSLFLLVYFALNKAETKRRQYALLIALLVIGIADYPRNEGASSFFIYVAGYAPFFVPRMATVLGLILADACLLFAEGWWLIGHPLSQNEVHGSINLGIAVFFVTVVGISNLVVAEGKRSDRKLRRAEREIVELAAVAERERIARDLHDVLGHTLSVIVLKAELAGKLIEQNPNRAAAEIADVERTARTALAEVREAIGGYRTQGLHAELSLARRALDAAGVALTLSEMEPTLPLNPEVQTVLSLTLREAVTNIVRHAHATHCRVSVTSEQGRLALTVEDDGLHPAPREGNGLRGMRERVQRIGGRFSLETAAGTRVRVELPVAVGAS